MRYLTTLAIFCFLLSCKNNTQEKTEVLTQTTTIANKKLSLTGGVRETVLDPITQDTLIYPKIEFCKFNDSPSPVKQPSV